MKPVRVKKSKSEFIVSKYAKDIRTILKNEGTKGISAKMIANT